MTKEKKEIPESIFFLCYIPFLFLIGFKYLKCTESSYYENLKLHISQGKLVTFWGLIVFILDTLNAYVFVSFLPLLAFVIMGYIIAVVWILWLSLMVKGMINTVKNNHKPLPIIGKLFMKG